MLIDLFPTLGGEWKPCTALIAQPTVWWQLISMIFRLLTTACWLDLDHPILTWIIVAAKIRGMDLWENGAEPALVELFCSRATEVWKDGSGRQWGFVYVCHASCISASGGLSIKFQKKNVKFSVEPAESSVPWHSERPQVFCIGGRDGSQPSPALSRLARCRCH